MLHFGISCLDTKLILALKLTWFRPTNTSHLMTLILQYITLTPGSIWLWL